MKTEFEGFCILDPDSEPIFHTMLECETEQECISNFIVNNVPFLTWDVYKLKGYDCKRFTMGVF